MAVIVRGLGHPWVHKGIACDRCQVSPIEGFRHKCETCSNDHNLCEKCYRQAQPHYGHRFIQIARDSSEYHPAFQIYYITCRECGQAPIEGRCHRHKWRPSLDLCEDCYARQPQSGNPALQWEVLDEPKISTICRTHSPVYHFHKECGSCGISPISGPRFDAVSYPEYSLCLICFDSKFVKGLVKNADYLRIERPEPHKVRHIFMHSCRNCGEVPIDGPAYVSKRVQDKVLCLLCYMNIQPQVQLEYSRVDAPAQLGDPPRLGLPQLAAGTVSIEEYSNLAKEFEMFKEKKETSGRVVASNLLNRAHEVEKLRKDLEEANRVAADHAKVSQELQVSKVDQEELTRVRADYAILLQAFEKLKVEKEGSTKASDENSALFVEIERLRVDKEEAMKVSADLAQELKKEKEEAARVNADLAQELKEEKEEAARVNADLAQELKEEKEEAARVNAALSLEVETLKGEREEAATTTVLEHLNLMTAIEKLKKETEEAAEVAGDNYRTLIKENERLKAEKEEALELATLGKDLEILEEGEEMTKSSVENLILVQEVERLKEEKTSLALELETLKEQSVAARVSAEEGYVNLTREFDKFREEREQVAHATSTDYCRVVQEVEMLKEEKEVELRVKAEEQADLTKQFEILKLEKGELERTIVQDYADLVQKCEKLTEDKAWLVQEVENVYNDKEEAGTASAENEAVLADEVKRLKQELDAAVKTGEGHANLSQECEKLRLEKEATAVLHASLVRRVEKLEREKEEVSKLSAADYSRLVAEVETLKDEKEAAMNMGAADYSKLSNELERLKEEKEEAVQVSAANYSNLVVEVDRLKKEKEELVRTSSVAYSGLSEEIGRIQKEKEEVGRSLEEKYLKFMDEYEKLKAEKEEIATLHSSLVSKVKELELEKVGRQEAAKVSADDHSTLLYEYEKVRGEKDAAAALSASLTLELEKVDTEAAADYSRLAQEFETYKEKQGNIVIANTPEYKKLLRESEIVKKNLQEELTQVWGDLGLSEEKTSELRRTSDEKYSKLSEEFEKLKAENAEALRSAAECSKLSDELEKLKSSSLSFDLSGLGKCAQIAVCTYGAIMLRKKIDLEKGYAKSILSRADSKTLHDAEKFLAGAAKELNDEYESFKYEARTITDEEAREFYLTTALPAQNKKLNLKAGVGKISEELAAAKQRFGK